MKCDPETLSEFLDGRPSPELEAHLAACPACRGELEALRRADTALRGHPALKWKPEMTERVLAGTRPRRRWRTLAAAAVLAGLVTFFAWPRPAIPKDDLARHVTVVELLAKQESSDPEVIRIQMKALRLSELTERLDRPDAPEEVRSYAHETRLFLATGDPKALVTLNGTAAALGIKYEVGSVVLTLSDVTTTNDVELYALGQLQIASGDVSSGTVTLNVLIDTQPESRYTSWACKTLGRVYQQKGDAVEALVTYTAITEPTAITIELARDIQKTSTQAGIVYVGGDLIETLDAAEVRRRVVDRTPIALVGKTDVTVMGTEGIKCFSEVRLRNSSAVLDVGRRRAVVDPKRLTERDLSEMEPNLRTMMHALREK